MAVTTGFMQGGHQPEKPEKSGNLKVVRENTKSQGKCVLAFGMPAITLFSDY